MDKASLLQKRGVWATTEVPVEGGSVKIRKLTRGEVQRLDPHKEDAAEFERHLLSFALVEPKLTPEEVGVWQDNSEIGEIKTVWEKALEISGLSEEADKSGLPEDEN